MFSNLKSQAKEAFVNPLAKHMRINPNVITLVAIVIMAAASYFAVYISLILAGALVFVSGFFDMIDGSIAKLHKKETRFGAFFDRTADRINDLLILVSIVIVLSPVYIHLLLGLVVISLVFLSSYMSSCIEALTKTKSGEALSWRGIRLLVITIGLLISQPLYTMVILLIISIYTTAERFYTARKVLG
ncbi:MAG: CDP-alcohol phosphatidyltransferase family protein [Candidatus Aenigmarchaeota archaeon]|nr:CDP-alcohol phosphatidyltransferase family protein [Candidatus Aenigmarchaeota archaeon]